MSKKSLCYSVYSLCLSVQLFQLHREDTENHGEKLIRQDIPFCLQTPKIKNLRVAGEEF